MLRSVLMLLLAAVLLSSAAADPVQWLGWDEVPVFLPDTAEIQTVTFTSPVALAVIQDMGITVVNVQDARWSVNAFTSAPASQSASNKLEVAMPSVTTLPINDQAAIIHALVLAWEGFYAKLGGNGKSNENHFARERAALLKRAQAQGLTADVLDACRAYRAQLQAATDAPRH